MNKSIKFLAISLLMIPTLARAADDSEPQSWGQYAWAKVAYTLSGVTSGAQHFGTGVVCGLPGGATAACGDEIAARVTKNKLGQEAIGKGIVFATVEGTQRTTKFVENKFNIDTTRKTNFQKWATYFGNGTGWVVANFLVASAITEAKRKAS